MSYMPKNHFLSNCLVHCLWRMHSAVNTFGIRTMPRVGARCGDDATIPCMHHHRLHNGQRNVMLCGLKEMNKMAMECTDMSTLEYSKLCKCAVQCLLAYYDKCSHGHSPATFHIKPLTSILYIYHTR